MHKSSISSAEIATGVIFSVNCHFKGVVPVVRKCRCNLTAVTVKECHVKFSWQHGAIFSQYGWLGWMYSTAAWVNRQHSDIVREYPSWHVSLKQFDCPSVINCCFIHCGVIFSHTPIIAQHLLHFWGVEPWEGDGSLRAAHCTPLSLKWWPLAHGGGRPKQWIPLNWLVSNQKLCPTANVKPLWASWILMIHVLRYVCIVHCVFHSMWFTPIISEGVGL